MTRKIIVLSVLSILFANLAQGDLPHGNLFWSTTLDNKIPRLMKLNGVPGVAVAVISGGKPVLVRGYGYSDKEEKTPVTEDTVFQAASISKTISAWAVMQLVQEGALDLDVPVSRFLTHWQLPKSVYDNDRVTLRRILSHTAGLSVGGYFGFAPGQPLQTLEGSLSAAEDSGNETLRVVYPPGEEWNYSGGGYTLLQLLIAEASHQSFANFTYETVLYPLGMRSSTFHQSVQMGTNHAISYDETGKRMPDYRYTAQAAAGLRTNARDLAQFVAALMKGASGELPGRGVLSPDTINHMLEPQPNTANNLYQGSEWGIGYGLKRLGKSGGWLAFHPGDNVPGWHGLVAAIPEKQVGLVVLTNGQGGRALRDEVICLWLRVADAGSLSECEGFEK